jgi:CHAT domain-containing protein
MKLHEGAGLWHTPAKFQMRSRSSKSPEPLTFASTIQALPVRRTLICFCLLLSIELMQGSTTCAFSQVVQNSIPLEQGKPIERQLAGGESHYYQLNVDAGQYVYVIVDQKGIDVVASLFGPDGKLITAVDGPNGSSGAEPVHITAEATGIYRIEVTSFEKDARPGRYEVKLVELRSATQRDRDRLTARRAFDEAEKLKNQNTRESMEAAIKKYEEALDLYRVIRDRSEQYTMLLGIGNTELDLQQWPLALERFDQAFVIAQELKDKFRQGRALERGEAVYIGSGEWEKALQKSAQSLQFFEATGDKNETALMLGELGAIYNHLGEWEKALQRNDEALQIYQAIGDKNNEAAILKRIGKIYNDLGEYEKAREYIWPLVQIYQALKDGNGKADVLESIGYTYHLQEDNQKVLEYYLEALPLWQASKNKRREPSNQSFIAGEYARAGDRQKAVAYAAQALQLAQASGNKGTEATVHINVGHAYYLLGEFEKALGFYEEPLRHWQTTGNKLNEAITHSHIAAALRDLGRLDEAKFHIEQSIALMEFIREHAGNAETQASFVSNFFDFYHLYIDVLMRLHEANPKARNDLTALAFTEKVKLRSLVQLLAQARVELQNGVDGPLLERERKINERITVQLDNIAKLVNGRYTKDQKSAAERALDALKSEQRQVQTEIAARNSRYAALAAPQPLSISEIQQQVLDNNTMLLEFGLGKDRSYVWAVTRDGIRSYQLPPKEKIEAQARRVYELLTARQPAPKLTVGQQRAREVAADLQFKTEVRVLSKMLLAPVAAQLGSKRLLIVADGALQYVPFAVIPSPTETTSDARPLILDHEIVNLPSASVLAALRRELVDRKPAAKGVAVLADPVFEVNDARVKSSLASHKSSGGAQNQAQAVSTTSASTLKRALSSVRGGDENVKLKRLLFSRDEAEAILSLTSQQSNLEALDFRANRKLAMSDELSRYRIVHFSTHGLLDSHHPELSGLVLSLVDEAGRPQEGFLRLHEIYTLRLNADLVVLSACQTGLGKEVRGEGLIGLVRGFMYAGAPRVMASMWEVDDAATAELMKNFYRGVLVEKLTPAAALRAAQIKMLSKKHWQAPYYWGAFMLQGEWR